MSTFWHIYDATDRAEITRLLGTVISIAGLFLASPAGTARLASSVVSGMSKLRRQHHPQVLPVAGRSGSASGTTGWVGVAHGSAAPLSVAQRLDHLDTRVDNLDARVAEAAAQHATDIAKLSAELREAASASAAALEDLRSRLDAAEAEAAHVDARALPVILIGVVLGPLASALSSPLWLWALVTGGLTVLSALIAARVYRAHHSERRVPTASGA